ncbi:citrate lyase acyl carrier protein [Oceanivirga salmonicida]|uniref:citrate lyase acyl carrier protein n=1 Tax=Oceanivirga salmonicida TaxID=1769291 RepID=UPI0008330A3A|nr:citrate lyase acyl carrier protein [Oceanivirga salmonicida]
MELKIKAYAGTLESSDIYIIAEPNNVKEIEIDLKSSVFDQFSEKIKEVVLDVLKEMEVDSAKLTIDDRGALDAVIKARMQAVIMRSAQCKKFKWN